ncbi:hypothetical protein AB0M57_02310 [Streptomyces sp. NPDC051597]|uniref:hypothetical protein n=1 Tax=Streptomyces sp. NPDC051597 TaxID=3155049 RepID=UPI0034228950
MLRRRMRFTAVLAGVVLALTGFSGHGHGKSGGGGGGCSNSHKSNGGSSSGSGSGYRHTDDDDYDSTGGSGSGSGSRYTPSPTPTPTPTPSPSASPAGSVVTCVAPAEGKRRAVTSATVRVTADPLASDNRRYRLEVDFLGPADKRIDTGSTFVTLDAGESRNVEVPMREPARVAEVQECRLTQVMEWS